MSWAEVKKINNNMTLTIDELINYYLSVGYREYIYNSMPYIVPATGIYTIRAFDGTYGSYGKVIKQFTKGEILTITIFGGNLSIFSNLQSEAIFSIKLTKDSYVNSNSADSLGALAIAGAVTNAAGGNAYVRSNNGIAAGGGGHGAYNNGQAGYAGGSAYAWGNNVYALGGGGGGGRGNAGTGGAGGFAFVNDVEITTYCSDTELISGRGYNGGTGYYSSSYPNKGAVGGIGGCGGGSSTEVFGRGLGVAYYFAPGYFSDGGYHQGGSARGGNIGQVGSMRSEGAYNNAIKTTFSPKGYFAGGLALGIGSDDYARGGIKGGTGGFVGGQGSTATYYQTAGVGGTGTYGIGGVGGTGDSGADDYPAASGGTGKIIGGKGGATTDSKAGGAGGSGYYGGLGTSGGSNGTSTGKTTTLFSRPIIGTAPTKDITPATSIVIIEYGNSPENF